jgi:hypothetical protein
MRFIPIALLCVAGGLMADDPKPDTLYMPTKEGAKRVMETTFIGDAKKRPASELVETISKVEAKDGKYRVTVDRDFKGKVTSSVYEVSDKGLSRLSVDGKDLTEPSHFLRLPAKKGDTWTAGKNSYTVGEMEEVEVPAGKFKAIPVTNDAELNGQKMKATAWYAPGVGMVKTTTILGELEMKSVLKTFTPAK